jgi:hypothetical protein
MSGTEEEEFALESTLLYGLLLGSMAAGSI